ncbi:uncharacterized protein V1518DRAFT_413439 [Limtongia smithiae]|uniref:uncharacterized protein n=1 Tax=Limtongia smithiae TaxID=1125753 RepID=UPI0034CD88FB
MQLKRQAQTTLTLPSPSKIKRETTARRLPPAKRTWTLGEYDKIHQCLEHVESNFEGELYESGVTFLESILTAQFPEMFGPSPEQLGVLLTLISHPRFAGMDIPKRKKKTPKRGLDMEIAGINFVAIETGIEPKMFVDPTVSAISRHVLLNLLSTDITVRELGFYEVLGTPNSAKWLRKSGGLNYAGMDPYEPEQSEAAFRPRGRPHKKREIDMDDEYLDSVMRSKGLKPLWNCAEQDVWRIIGWAFLCGSANGAAIAKNGLAPETWTRLEARWPPWKETLKVLLKIIEKDWAEVVQSVEQLENASAKECALKQSLICQFLLENGSLECRVQWKRALSAVFSVNAATEVAHFLPVYPGEVGEKTMRKLRSSESGGGKADVGLFGDAETVELRKRFLGVAYEALRSITGLIDHAAFFREMASYLRPAPLECVQAFLQPPEQMTNQSEYCALLCDALLQPHAQCPRLPKNWIYNYESGKQYIAQYVRLAPEAARAEAGSAVRMAVVVEALFRRWVKVRRLGMGSARGKLRSADGDAGEDGALTAAVEAGAAARAAAQEAAVGSSAVLRATETRLRQLLAVVVAEP